MDSVWFACEDNDYETGNSSSDSFLGVFNQDPNEVHSWLQRPQAPFVVSSSLPTPYFNTPMHEPAFACSPLRQSFGFPSSYQEAGLEVSVF